MLFWLLVVFVLGDGGRYLASDLRKKGAPKAALPLKGCSFDLGAGFNSLLVPDLCSVPTQHVEGLS